MARNPLHSDVQFVRDPRLPEVELRTCSYSTEAFRPHTHEGYSLALVEGGATRFDVNGHCAPAIEGDIVIIPPHAAHACNPDPHISYRLFYIESGWLEDVAASTSANLDRPDLGQVIKDPALFTELLVLHREISEGDVNAQTSARLRNCVIRMLREHQESAVPAEEHTEPTIDAARQILEERWAESVSVNELAEKVGANRYQLIRGFKQATGLTPHAYQLQLRVEAARKSLAHGESITQVALECGFADQSHFTRVFREHTGATPSQYQNA